MNWKWILGILLIGLMIGGVFGYQKYQQIFAPNVPTALKQTIVAIPTGSTYDEIVDLLYQEGFLKDSASFNWVAEQMQYRKADMRTGRFEIKPNWSNRELITHLRGGKQATVKVVLTNERFPENVAAKAAQFIESDSLEIQQVFEDESYLQEHGFSKETLISLFIPNTYDFYWNTKPKAFFERMLKEHKAFWDKNNRRKKAKALNLTPAEVYTLASIVEKETNQNAEKSRIAGVYLNRLNINMALQADPTAVFATRDFSARRVLHRHIEFDSPYNTYKYPGLPPGPISMASIASIDAVLNAENHKYLYFCAKPDDSGFHAFAKSLSAHNVNARRFHRWLRKRGL